MKCLWYVLSFVLIFARCSHWTHLYLFLNLIECFFPLIIVLFSSISAILLQTSFCAKRVSKPPSKTYFYGWHRPLSFLSTSWCWLCAFCPPCRLFTEDSGTWIFFSDHQSLCSQFLKMCYFIYHCSGQTMKLDLKLEDGRIGEHPEVIYHVFHTMLFGGLTLLFDGYLDKHIFYIIWISNIKYW